MRKFMLAGVFAALAVVLLAVSASASFDRHFSVIARTTSVQRVGEHAFRFKDKLFQVQNRHNRVGRAHGRCREISRRKVRCRGVVHLNGEVGGFGDILVNGDRGPHDRRANVVGGTGDFNGVAGKLLFRNLGATW
jgi:hypothetical protein